MPQDRPTIAYLKSLYPYATDTFVRWEVQQLREQGFEVLPFSVRRPAASMAVSDDIVEEQKRTEYLLENKSRLMLAGLKALVKSPGRFLSACWLAMRTGAPGIVSRLKQAAYLLEAALLAEHMRARGARHLHNHIGENSAAVAMLASHLSGIPYSLTIHGPKEFDKPQFIALGEKIRRAAFVVAVSEFGRSQLFRWADHTHWSKIHVVHCGVNGQFLRGEPPPPPEQPRFVCVGRLCDEKGQILLIEATARLVREGLMPEVVLVGDGPIRPTLEELIDGHRISEQVRITGWLSSDRVRQEILAARALVLPSFAEGLPVAIMESLALHRPVISTYIAGIPELVEHGKNGWLVPAGSIDALTEAMRQAMAASPQELAEMGRHGFGRVEAQHDVVKEAAKLGGLLRGALERKRG